MNSPEIKQFIREHRNLFWYIPEDKKEVEGSPVVLNYYFELNDVLI